MRAVITGATGFVGRRLLQEIGEPIILSRDPERVRQAMPKVEVYHWDPLAGMPPAEAFAGAEAVFHLAGEPVGEGRWTAEKKQRIHDSRAVGTANLVAALGALGHPPPVLISASAIGYYGSRGDDVLDESSAPGDDFLARVCRDWEAAAVTAEASGMRVVRTRLGIVLGRGGALAKMLFPFKLGLGGRLGSGRQWMSWIHVDDVAGLLLHAAKTPNLRGPMNLVSPAPVTNRQFTRALAAAVHRPAIFPVPALGLRIAVGGFSEVLLSSQRVLPHVAERNGYEFRYRDLSDALQASVSARADAAGTAVARR